MSSILPEEEEDDDEDDDEEGKEDKIKQSQLPSSRKSRIWKQCEAAKQRNNKIMKKMKKWKK